MQSICLNNKYCTSMRKVTARVKHINIDKTFSFSWILPYFSISFFCRNFTVYNIISLNLRHTIVIFRFPYTIHNSPFSFGNSEKFSIINATQFTLPKASCLDLFSVLCATNAFSFKLKYKKLAVVVHVLLTTQNLVISRCCFAENGKEIYQEL